MSAESQPYDLSIFKVESSSTPGDKQTFLRLMQMAGRLRGKYTYMETGSYLGGSLYPHVVNDQCASIYSIDSRPDLQYDERPVKASYAGMTTAAMMSLLGQHASPEQLKKVRTFDMDARSVPERDVPVKIDLALIDGEHTNVAAFSDFVSVYRFMSKDGIVAFHDANLISDAILNSSRMLSHLGVQHEVMFLPDVVGVILLGESIAACSREWSKIAFDHREFIIKSKQTLREDICYAVQNRLHVGLM